MSNKVLVMLYSGRYYTKPTIKTDEGSSVLIYSAFA